MMVYEYYTKKTIGKKISINTKPDDSINFIEDGDYLTLPEYELYAYTTDKVSDKMFRHMRNPDMFKRVKRQRSDNTLEDFGSHFGTKNEMMILNFRSEAGIVPVLGPKHEYDTVVSIEEGGMVQSLIHSRYNEIMMCPIKDEWHNEFSQLNEFIEREISPGILYYEPGVVNQFKIYLDIFGKTLDLRKLLKGD